MKKIKFVDLGCQYVGIKDQVLSKIDEILCSGSYILGEELNQFEKRFANYCQSKYAIGVANGSDALYISLLGLGVGPGDEVITVPNSFIATAWVIEKTGAKIVYCDVDHNMNLDPSLLEACITKKTKAIMPVHLTGRVANLDEISEIANRYNIPIIEDAAQAVGAVYKKRKAGSFGKVAGFSLHPLKNLGVFGDGGIITTNDDKVDNFVRTYRNHGLINRDYCESWGVNSRLDEIHAGVANIKLDYIDEWNETRRKYAAIYRDNLKDYVGVPDQLWFEQPVYHRFIITYDERDKLKDFLLINDIETKVNYPVPLHLLSAAKSQGYIKGDFPRAEKFANTILSLPLHEEMTPDDIFVVTEKIIEYITL